MGEVIHFDFRRPDLAPTPRFADEWPAAHGTVRLITRTAPDHLGCQDFYALWRDSDGAKRFQAFIGVSLAGVQSQMREHGLDVEIVERVGIDLRRAL